ncbi:AraC family transcriptional regulator N-terminal domain-containing protein [Streptomyces sp. R39]|uniref:AraC family transcriptional regulator N-terminal domain-containing protein n=1 Tax=Streptomyces sp. R39 TaxID=3238631 RepID=A0AB39QNT4_9ACTN
MPLDELRTLLDRHARPGWTTAVDGVLISKVDRAEPPAPATSGTVLAVIAQGGKRLALGERVYEYGPGQYLVASVDLPVTGQFRQVEPERPALGFGLTLEPSAVAELLLQARPAGTPSAIAVNYAQPFRVEDVARLSGMSVSAFYRNFQAVTAMSPIQFQKQIRLQEARLLLAAHPGDVTGVGRRVGYDNPSQFSREYRRRFGAPPSRDAAHPRATAPAPAGALA